MHPVYMLSYQECCITHGRALSRVHASYVCTVLAASDFAVQPTDPALVQDVGAVTTAAFSPDAAHVAVACTGALLLYDLDSYGLSSWSRQHGAAMATRLKGVGNIHSISFQPADKVSHLQPDLRSRT